MTDQRLYRNGAIPHPTAPDSVGTGNATYSSIGCYIDQVSNRTLSGYFTTSDTMTPASCAATCYSMNYRLAGVEFGRECVSYPRFTFDFF